MPARGLPARRRAGFTNSASLQSATQKWKSRKWKSRHSQKSDRLPLTTRSLGAKFRGIRDGRAAAPAPTRADGQDYSPTSAGKEAEMTPRAIGLRLLLSVGFLLPGTVMLSAAQVTTGTILGTVRDSSGAVLPGVAVTVTNTDTNVVRMAVTDDRGDYVVRLLPVGTYRVETALDGFKRFLQTGIVVELSR